MGFKNICICYLYCEVYNPTMVPTFGLFGAVGELSQQQLQSRSYGPLARALNSESL